MRRVLYTNFPTLRDLTAGLFMSCEVIQVPDEFNWSIETLVGRNPPTLACRVAAQCAPFRGS